MQIRRVLECCFMALLSIANLNAATSEVADAVMNGDRAAVRALLLKKADVNAPRVDGATALHWAVRMDDSETADLLIRAGASPAAANREGATPLMLAALNGSAPMIEKLVKAGADVNAKFTRYEDTALMMAARTGKADAVRILLDSGAKVDSTETWGGTTPLMWAASEGHAAVARLLIDRGANINMRSYYGGAANGRGFEGQNPQPPQPGVDFKPIDYGGGWFTPLMFASREGHMEVARLLIAAGADLNVISGDAKTALHLAIFNGNYELASFLVDNKADVNHADVLRFTPLFWAVDRRNMELGTNGLPWTVTTDVMPLIKKLLDNGANPNAVINNTPRARQREASPRIVVASALMRAAFAGDLELCKLLLSYGADPHARSSDRESMIAAAAGHALIPGYQYTRPSAERLELVKLLVTLGEDVNWADNYGITPLMGAASRGETAIVEYLVSVGADLNAHDLGKRLDGSFMSSREPLMPIDYAIGVGTFLPNNSVVNYPETEALMFRLMKEKGITHTTSECTLRGFTCSAANVEPNNATPAQIALIRKIQIGATVDGVTGGLDVKDPEKK